MIKSSYRWQHAMTCLEVLASILKFDTDKIKEIQKLYDDIVLLISKENYTRIKNIKL
jgi:hypothetical protein